VLNKKQTRQFVFVNYSNRPSFQDFHGKAVGLDIVDDYVPFPALLIAHEMRVHGYQPFQPTSLEMPHHMPWQPWILSDGVFDEASNANTHFPSSPMGHLMDMMVENTTET
jgi:hypothetical protein